MKFSYAWLQEYFDEPLPPVADLSHTITMHAFEIDGTEPHGTDTILDIKVLPNRSHDCFSYHGVAREIGALLNVVPQIPDVQPKTEASILTAERLTLTVEDSKLVPRAMKRYVEGVTIGESPDWLKARLAVHGQRSINSVVDATNLTMWETGQPVHAFDFDKLSADKAITIRSAREGESITTLDGKEFTLDPEMLVISDSDKALDVAGVKGGSTSGIDASTTRIVLSMCNFDPVSIRKTSKKLGLRTDASVRFEQGITPELTAIAMERLSSLVEELAGGKVSADVIDVYPAKEDLSRVTVSMAEINTALGATCSPEEVTEYFARLGFGYEMGEDTFVVTIPAPRLDIRIKEDLIEEIGRLKGLEAIPSTQLSNDGFVPAVNKNEYYKSLIRQTLLDVGFSEVSTYAFQQKGEVEVANPLADDKKYLRSSLVDGLTAALEMNKKNKPLLGVDTIRIFEIGTVFDAEREYLQLGVISEDVEAAHHALDCVVSDPRCTSGRPPLKTSKVDLLGLTFESSVLDETSPKMFFIDNTDKKTETGIADLTDWFKDLKEPDSYGDLSRLPDMTFVPISIYPFILRDIAVWVTDGDADSIPAIVRTHGGPLVARIDQFDTFTKEGRTSYAYHIVFQSHEKTLSDDEVGAIMKKIEDDIKGKGWEVR